MAVCVTMATKETVASVKVSQSPIIQEDISIKAIV